MCGRYSLGLRPAQVRQMLQHDNMPVDDAPEDEGDNAPRQSYNFAPGYHGIVYRADTPDWGAGPHRHAKKAGDDTEAADEAADQVSSTSPGGGDGAGSDRNPDYGSMMKTINCRDDSLAQGGGMWNTMKARKRCIVVAQGFYEWLKKDGGREKIPHFVKRRDGALMCFAGLWDCVQYEDDEKKHYTYTIITTDSNKQLKFLHDRMPVILNNGSEELRTWLDPHRYEWSKDLQSLLKPFDGELEVYPVSKDVGKVGNNSPTFLIPIDSKENKSNIANFFGKGASTVKTKAEASSPPQKQPEVEIKKEAGFVEDGSRDDVDTADNVNGDKAKDEGGNTPKTTKLNQLLGLSAKRRKKFLRGSLRRKLPSPRQRPSRLPHLERKGELGLGRRSVLRAMAQKVPRNRSKRVLERLHSSSAIALEGI
ncbi:hypothetical protein PG993_006716 [Apiospora rasikravindrae]|uniref:DUF159 domain protein n=1 Tax=Apiospora rasikravindrae TaxID=990691 RepID=A0ABR1T6H3_9PEZI